ncbi:hypothetical protein D3C81_457000 [compost metagenome]
MVGTTVQGVAPTLSWGRRAYQHPGEYLGTGNRCGHKPEQLAEDRLALPQVRGGFYLKIQQQLIDAAKRYFYAPRELTLLSNLSRKRNHDGMPRQNRSEGREAQSLVLSAILSMTDFASLRVGTPMADGSFRSRSCDELARACGLTRPSRDPEHPEPVASGRFYRALAQLKQAAAITLYEQYEVKEDGSKRARVAIKTVSESFLIVLGRLSFAAFRAFRDECSKKLRKFRNNWRHANPQVNDVIAAGNAVQREQQARGLPWSRALPKRKNRAPRPEVDPVQQLKDDYAQHVQDIEAKIADKYPGIRIGMRDRLKLFAELGGMTWDAWLRR